VATKFVDDDPALCGSPDAVASVFVSERGGYVSGNPNVTTSFEGVEIGT